MNFYLSLAWRNIWRNKKRTWITLASVIFSVIIALITRSMQLGSYAYIVNNTVSSYTGYFQIQEKNYFENKSLDDSFHFDDKLNNILSNTKGLTLLNPRIENFILASNKDKTRPALIMGIDPLRENEMSKLKGKLIAGKYITSVDKSIMLSEGLAKYLSIKEGDDLVLYGQGMYGQTAAGIYKIKGILRFIMPEINSRMIFIPLNEAKNLFSTEDKISKIAVMIDDVKRLDKITTTISKQIDKNLKVLSWKKMMPEIEESIKLDNASGLIMLGILYLVIGFGMLGTQLMMTLERKKEFAILIASGMNRYKIAIMSLLESTMIGVVGVFMGIAVTFPFLVFFFYNPIPLTGKAAEGMLKFGYEPILPFSLQPYIFISQAINIFLIAIFISLFPLLMIYRINLVTALKE